MASAHTSPQSVKAVRAIKPQTVSGTVDGADIDATPSQQKFYNYKFFVNKTNGDSGDDLQFTVYHKSSGGSYSELTDDDGNKFQLTLDSSADENGVINVENTTHKDKLRLELDSASFGATDADISSTCVKLGAKDQPV